MKIALITLDSVRYDYAINVSSRILKPIRDTLFFHNHFSTSNFTLPSVASILTSAYPLMFGGFKSSMERRMSLPEILKDYTTLCIHSNALITARKGFTKGFKKSLDLKQTYGKSKLEIYLDYVIRDKMTIYARAEEMVDRVKKELPKLGSNNVFLWLHFMDNHHPYLPPAEFSEGMLTNPIKRARHILLFRGYGRNNPVSDEGKRRKIRKLYELTVKYVDHVLGQLVEELGDDWILIITSDHGDEFWEHGGESHQRKLYDELIHVPMIIHGLDEKGEIRSLSDHTDLAPTILDIAGIEKPGTFVGESVFESKREYVYSENYGIYAMRDLEYKLIYDENRNRIELYDLRKDPKEQNNIARDEPDILREYMIKLERHRKKMREFELRTAVSIAKQRLRL